MTARIHRVKGTVFGYEQAAQGATWREAFLAMVDDLRDDAARFHVPIEDLAPVVDANAHLLDAVEEPSLIHFDLWDGNILVEDGEVTGLIDDHPDRGYTSRLRPSGAGRPHADRHRRPPGGRAAPPDVSRAFLKSLFLQAFLQAALPGPAGAPATAPPPHAHARSPDPRPRQTSCGIRIHSSG